MKASEIKNKTIKVKVTPNNMTYPRSGFKSGDFAIIKFRVDQVIEGEIPDECGASIVFGDSNENAHREYIICVKGNFPSISFISQYILTGELVIDKTWGPQYNLIAIRLDYNLQDANEQKKFFSFFMTENQVNALFESVDNPISLLENKDIGELCKVKGIGPSIAQKLCERYEGCKDNSTAYIGLKDLGLTKNAIDKLVKFYGSPDIVISKIDANPYILATEVSGYGWLKTDAIAMKKGFAKDCRFRVEAYTKYFLEQQADQAGNSWVKINDLLSAVATECYPVTNENLNQWLKEIMIGPKDFEKYYAKMLAGEEVKPLNEMPLLFYDPEQQKVGLFSLRFMEKEIARHLKRIKSAPCVRSFSQSTIEMCIEEAENQQGFKYTDEQKQTIFNIVNNNVSILTGSAGCVDCDTEYFNGHEWKKISEYQTDEKVLMYNPDGTAELVIPSDYVKYPAEHLWLIQTKCGIDMCLSEEHNVYYVTSKGNLYHNTLANIKALHDKSKGGFSGQFITSFKFGGAGIELTDPEIKVMLAVICDGTFASTTNLCRLHIKKDRKKEELRKILSEAQISFKEHVSAAEGYIDFYFYAPRREKEFTQYWYNCSQQQLQLICDNVLFWDGHADNIRRRFSANNLNNATFVQYAFTSCGYKAVLSSRDRRGQTKQMNGKQYIYKSIDYNVSITNRSLISLGGNHVDHTKPEFKSYKTLDGYKYCFTVPTHMWVMRRNGKIVVTGNTGKTTTLTAVVKVFKRYGLQIQQCALSGRAASKLKEVTKIDGKTIHRTLCYIPDKESFKYNERCKMPHDVIILDETSMVGGDIFLSLIQAIRDGAKLIMVGDIKQLEAIGLANVLKDCMGSAYIPTSMLSKIHRQAAASGIITQSINMSNGMQMCKNDFVGEEIRGELKDFKLVASYKPEAVSYNIIREFRRLYNEQHIPADQIQVIVPMRVRGNISCNNLNSQIQEIVNPGVHPRQVFQQYTENGTTYQVCYKPGDRIIVVKNNYHAKTPEGKEVAIFNGNLGVIKDIYNNSMIVEVDGVDKVVLSKDEWYDINLAYAITCHKLQGSQAPYCIVGLNTSCYALYSKEWLYTAVTRATKFCALVVQTSSLNQAVRISHVKTKQTWLCKDLVEFYLAEHAGEGFN